MGRDEAAGHSDGLLPAQHPGDQPGQGGEDRDSESDRRGAQVVGRAHSANPVPRRRPGSSGSVLQAGSRPSPGNNPAPPAALLDELDLLDRIITVARRSGDLDLLADGPADQGPAERRINSSHLVISYA